MPHKIWAVGEEVLAADFNDFVQEQVVATFPNAAARTAAIPSPQAGQLSTLSDGLTVTGAGNHTLDQWNGSAWRQVGAMANFTVRGGSNVVTTGADGSFNIPITPAYANGLSFVAVAGDVQLPFFVQLDMTYFNVDHNQVRVVCKRADNSAFANSVVRVTWMLLEQLQ